MKKRIVIIGAGLGGLTAGALLVKKGADVRVFEKESVVGGRALTLDGSTITHDAYKSILHRFDCWMPRAEPSLETIFDRNLLDGYRLDLGFHLLGFIDKSPIVRLIRQEKRKHSFSASRFGLLSEDGSRHPVFLSSLNVFDVLRVMPHLLRLLFATRKYLSGYETVSIRDVIQRYCRGTAAHASEIAARLVSTVNDLDRISAHEILRVGKKWNSHVKPVGYPRGGSGALAEGLADIIRYHGGTVSPNSPVERIIVEDNEMAGVRVDGRDIPCDFCISGVPVQDLHRLMDDGVFPEGEAASLRKLEGTGSVCAYYGLRTLDHDLIGTPFTFLQTGLPVEAGTAAGIIDFQTARPDIGISPPDRFLVQAYIICTPAEAKDKKIVLRLIRVLDDKMEALFPGFREHMDFALYPTSYHLDGVAKILGQPKPGPATSISGLYLVGDCVQSTGIGMNCAADSAFRLVKQLVKDGS